MPDVNMYCHIFHLELKYGEEKKNITNRAQNSTDAANGLCHYYHSITKIIQNGRRLTLLQNLTAIY